MITGLHRWNFLSASSCDREIGLCGEKSRYLVAYIIFLTRGKNILSSKISEPRRLVVIAYLPGEKIHWLHRLAIWARRHLPAFYDLAQ